MIVAKVFMWPKGDWTRSHLLSTASLACLGQAIQDEPSLGVRKGERIYRVKLFRDVAFGGPVDGADLLTARTWRTGSVRGHMPGPRGVWDVLGGALKVLLGTRLAPYQHGNADERAPAYEEVVSDRQAVADGLRRLGETGPPDRAEWYRAAAAFVEGDSE